MDALVDASWVESQRDRQKRVHLVMLLVDQLHLKVLVLKDLSRSKMRSKSKIESNVCSWISMNFKSSVASNILLWDDLTMGQLGVACMKVGPRNV